MNYHLLAANLLKKNLIILVPLKTYKNVPETDSAKMTAAKRRSHDDDIHDEDVENQQPSPHPMPPIILPQAFLHDPNTFKPVSHIGAMNYTSSTVIIIIRCQIWNRHWRPCLSKHLCHQTTSKNLNPYFVHLLPSYKDYQEMLFVVCPYRVCLLLYQLKIKLYSIEFKKRGLQHAFMSQNPSINL